jgi:hypothetical protein
MNKRIIELAEQAGSTHKQNLGVYQFFTYELEKFAELIIQECAKIGELKEQGFRDYDPNISVGWYMRKHFGFIEFDQMVEKGTKAWADTPDDWVDELRGGAEKP